MSLVCREFDKNCINNHLYKTLFNPLVSMHNFPVLLIFYISAAKYQYDLVQHDIQNKREFYIKSAWLFIWNYLL